MNEKSSAHVINYTPIVFTKKDHLMGRIEFFQPCYENSLRPLHKLTVWSCSTQCHKPLIKLCPCLPTPNKLAQTWPLRLSSQSVTSYPPHSRTRHRLAVFHPYTRDAVSWTQINHHQSVGSVGMSMFFLQKTLLKQN